MINFIFWPAAAFFDRALYRHLSRSSFKTGFLYLAYLSLILAGIMTAVVTFRIRPELDEFVAWWRKSFPGVTVTPDGFESPVQQPFELVHPRWGTILIIDTGREEDPELKDMLKTRIYLTKKAAHAWNFNKTRIRAFDFSADRKYFKDWVREGSTVTGEELMRFYENKYYLIVLFISVALYGIILAWKIYAAFFYSLIALVLDRAFSARHEYPGLFSISCLALTPVAVIQAVQVAGNFRVLNLLWAVAATAAFLAFALLGPASGEEKSGRSLL